jgi:uncharacterized OB-fold protein
MLQCPECGANMDSSELGSAGSVESSTIVHRASPPAVSPYTLCWIWLDERLRVLARWPYPEVPAIEARVRLATDRDGRLIAEPA